MLHKLVSGRPRAFRLVASADFVAQLRRLAESPAGAVLGAGLYAVWAVAVNWESGARTALGAGGAHWVMSALLTYYGALAMRRCFERFESAYLGACGAFAAGMLLTYAVLCAVHWLIGTPNLVLTLSLGFVPTTAFCASYATLLAGGTRMGGAAC